MTDTTAAAADAAVPNTTTSTTITTSTTSTTRVKVLDVCTSSNSPAMFVEHSTERCFYMFYDYFLVPLR